MIDKVSGLKLPHKRSKPSEELGDYSILIYGEKKIGKTQLSAQFPNCLQMMTEPGAKAVAGYQVAIPTWEHFRHYVRQVVKDPFYQNVSVDTADLAYQKCMKHVCKKLGIDHPSEEDWGKGWQAVRDEFTEQVDSILQSGKGAIFISHAAEREVKTRHGSKFDRLESTMAKAARSVLEGIVDIWVCITYENDERVMVIAGDDYISAGHRCRDNFRYRDGTSIEVIPMGETPEQAYENFVAAFNNELENPDAVSKKVPTQKKSITKKKGLRIKKGNE